MTFDELALSEGIWNVCGQANPDIVLKSRARFSRNFEGELFAHKLDRKERNRISKLVKESIDNLEDYAEYNLEGISEADKNIFIERNILSADGEGSGSLLVSQRQDRHFLLCERDHVKLTAERPGYDFNELIEEGRGILENLSKKAKFAYSSDFGYLTADPRCSGAALQLVMVAHLPMLALSGRFSRIADELDGKEVEVRSSWVEGYYDIFNKGSLRHKEKTMIQNVLERFEHVIRMERESRETGYSKNRVLIEDRVWRSWGILTSSRLMSLYEACDLLSILRLGVSLGIIQCLTVKSINFLLYFIQDMHLRKRFHTDIKRKTDEIRAQFIRDYLKEVM